MTNNKQSGVPDYLYIVNYCRGNVDEGFRRVNLFVTMEEETAKKYVQKFNSILKKCKKLKYKIATGPKIKFVTFKYIEFLNKK